jgi:hypothetical protein
MDGFSLCPLPAKPALFSATIEQKANLPKQRPQNIDFLVNEKLEEKLTSSFFVWLA